MKLPEHFTIQLDDTDRADLAAARRTFMASMEGLSPEKQLARARVIASGIRDSDPYTRALAKQLVDADSARAEIETAKRELGEIEADLRQGGHRPKNPSWRGEALERKEALQRQIEQTHARLIGIAEQDFRTAQRKAALEFRERRQHATKNAAFKAAIAAEEARLEQENLQRRAEAIAKRRRLAAGRPSGRNAGESQ